ncbi:hypothetical protein MHBO_005294 [Bonamia ostreae]|uniref:ATP-dependent DNA helicase n=1 Tax=Bonamia ostreae TaxID=126728 RepID=A0ABV2AGA7_9EUKA
MALTATATKKVFQDVKRILKFRRCSVYSSSLDRPNIFYAVLRKPPIFEDAAKLLENFIGKQPPGSPGIVYCATRSDCEKIDGLLNRHGVRASAYHSGIDHSSKTKIFEQWMSEKILVIVATTAFGMGINKDNVRFVVHFTLPQSLEALYQESGRGLIGFNRKRFIAAGRDGQPAVAALMYSPLDVITIAKISSKMTPILSLVQYAHSTKCRRVKILEPFESGCADQSSSEKIRCDKNCDSCASKQSDSFRALEYSSFGGKAIDLVKIIKARKTQNKNLTLKQLVKTWRGNGKKSLNGKGIVFLEKGNLKSGEAEQMVLDFVCEGVLALVLKHTAYCTNVYVSIGPKGNQMLFKDRKLY